MIRAVPALACLPALACVVAPVWLVAVNRSALAAAHPAYLVLAGGVGLLGAPLVLAARRRAWLSVPLAVLLVAPLVALQPFRATSPVAGGVDGVDSVSLVPAGAPRAGLVFYPGARVDHRAYLPLLAPLVDEGVLVVVVKPPLDLALLSAGAAADVLDAHREVRTWAVGGHSLGGVAAARYAAGDERVRGLLLWASYPVDDLSARTGLTAWSISGSADGLTTPADVEAARPLLPSDTRYEVVPGAVHAHFGEYGEQPGDGTPTTSREAARARIVAASAAALRELVRGGPGGDRPGGDHRSGDRPGGDHPG